MVRSGFVIFAHQRPPTLAHRVYFARILLVFSTSTLTVLIGACVSINDLRQQFNIVSRVAYQIWREYLLFKRIHIHVFCFSYFYSVRRNRLQSHNGHTASNRKMIWDLEAIISFNVCPFTCVGQLTCWVRLKLSSISQKDWVLYFNLNISVPGYSVLWIQIA